MLNEIDCDVLKNCMRFLTRRSCEIEMYRRKIANDTNGTMNKWTERSIVIRYFSSSPSANIVSNQIVVWALATMRAFAHSYNRFLVHFSSSLWMCVCVCVVMCLCEVWAVAFARFSSSSGHKMLLLLSSSFVLMRIEIKSSHVLQFTPWIRYRFVCRRENGQKYRSERRKKKTTKNCVLK